MGWRKASVVLSMLNPVALHVCRLYYGNRWKMRCKDTSSGGHRFGKVYRNTQKTPKIIQMDLFLYIVLVTGHVRWVRLDSWFSPRKVSYDRHEMCILVSFCASHLCVFGRPGCQCQLLFSTTLRHSQTSRNDTD